MMKRLLIYALPLCFSASTLACGDSSGNSSAATTSETDATSSTTSATLATTQATGVTSAGPSSSGSSSSASSTGSSGDTTSADATTGETTMDASTGGSSTSDTATDPTDGGECVIKECEGKVYECGDCIDNDGDGGADYQDLDCWGPCDNNEQGWKGEVPGQNDGQCKMDCYWDANTGSGNDECNWSHNCDELGPSAPKCEYDPDSNIQGTELSCAEAQVMQSEVCAEVCGPLTPNGCDCFGCCEVTVGDTSVTIYVGSTDDNDEGSCNLDNALDPAKCKPCTQVGGCLNTCLPDECEVCFGENLPPEECDEPGCPENVDSCLNDSDCVDGLYCVTGCCYPVPE